LHAVRIAIKRLRAILRLIRPVISETAFRRENAALRKAGQRLALSRDTTIARKTLSQFSMHVSNARLRQAFESVLDSLKERPSAAAINRALKLVNRDLEQSAQRLERLRISRDGWKVLKPGIRKVNHQARKRMTAAAQSGDDVSYHRWRTRVKALYYELQLLKATGLNLHGMTPGCLRELEKKLGANQDIAMLKEMLGKRGNDVRDQILVTEYLEKQSRKLKRKALALGESVFAE